MSERPVISWSAQARRAEDGPGGRPLEPRPADGLVQCPNCGIRFSRHKLVREGTFGPARCPRCNAEVHP